MHPLAPDLKDLKDEELYSKLQDLNNKMNQAYRFGNNSLLVQIQMLINDYQTEVNNRRQALLDKKDDKNLGSLIKVK